jgi:deoxyribodipyrimidine photo-lyase
MLTRMLSRDLPFKDPRDLKDVFTSFRNQVEPLREAPRKELPKPDQLPPLPDHVPPPAAPFKIPETYNGVLEALLKPLPVDAGMPNMPLEMPEGAESAHPFKGGSKTGLQRIRHLIESGSMTSYKDTRNGLIGQDFSTKLSAWLALGSVTGRQIHWLMVDFEDGKTGLGKTTSGYGKGENKGTAAVRFELLWRDYMRLCTKKFGMKLFMVDGYRRDGEANFKFISSPFTHSTAKKNTNGTNDADTRAAVERFVAGRTGMGLIDASQRELFLTGYTSNRTRQNVASYLSKHLGIDWRIGAEWYESCLVDYDVHSNWGNWQYVAGVGNDPRGAARVFNPVKQAVDYDPQGEYVRMWMPELRGVGRGGAKDEGGVSLGGDHQNKQQQQQQPSPESLMGVFQAWRIADEEKERLGLKGVEWVEKPLIRINFSVNRRGGGGKRGGGGGGGGPGGSSRGNGRGGRGGGRGGKGKGERGGREARSGMMEKAGWQN